VRKLNDTFNKAYLLIKNIKHHTSHIYGTSCGPDYPLYIPPASVVPAAIPGAYCTHYFIEILWIRIDLKEKFLVKAT